MTDRSQALEPKDGSGQGRGAIAPPLAVASIVVAILALQWRTAAVGLPLRDEAYLLLGLELLRDGATPFVDFQSYDLGRYYLLQPFDVAAGATGVFWGGHLLVAAAVVVVVAVVLRSLEVRSPMWAATLTGVLQLWASFPRHKAVDQVALLLLTASMIHLLRRRDLTAHLLAGLATGIAACIGRNHGLYGLVALVLTVSLTTRGPGIDHLGRRVAAMLGGVVIGWAPVAVALAADPRFRRSYVDVLLRNAGAGTNVPLPVPWPWSEAGSWSDALSLSFAGVATIAVAGLVVVVVRRRTIADSATLTVVAGAVVVGVPYLHHAFSRADAAHLAQVAAPALVVAWTLTCRAWASGGRVRPAAAATGLVVLAASCLVPLRGWPPGGAWVVHVDDRPLEPVDVRGETRLLRARDRQFLDAVTELSNELPSDARVAVVPRGADVYLHTERRPGIPQLYLGGPTNAQQRAELAELMTDVDWVLIEPGPYGGNPDTAFHLRYPEAWRTVVGRCERVPRLEDPRLPFEVRRCRA